MTPCRLLVIDDNPGVHASIRTRVSEDPAAAVELVAAATSSREGIELSTAYHPDAILLDIAMPDVDGIRALPALRAVVPDAAIVMHSSEVDRWHEAVRAGADACICKCSSWDRVRAVLLDSIRVSL